VAHVGADSCIRAGSRIKRRESEETTNGIA
jgi:hypothetical protein